VRSVFEKSAHKLVRSYIKWTDSRIERVVGDVRGAAIGLVL
jgi:hypothetical protein